jgi:hypothetical protein
MLLVFMLGIASCAFATDSWPDYTQCFQQKAGRLLQMDTMWVWNPQSAIETEIYWGHKNGTYDQVEYFYMQPNVGGAGYVRLTGYYVFRTGESIDQVSDNELLIIGSNTYNITSDGGSGPQHYALYDVWNGMDYVLKCWGKAYNQYGYMWDFYHEQHYYIETIYNPSWVGSGSKTRKCLCHEEAWWNTGAGWVWGSGQIGGNGKPTGSNVTYGRCMSEGYMAGMDWKYHEYGRTPAYLEITWSWQ